MSEHDLAGRTAAAMERRVAAEQAEARLPSLVAGVVRDGTLVWSGGRGRVGEGRADAGTQYRIGSITKTFVAVAVLRLRDEGVLSLDDPVGDHVPGTGVGHLRIGELLSQSSGIRAETAGPWWERTPGDDLAALAAASLGPDAARFEAGRRFHYSNVGFALLGAVVAAVRGRAWDEVVTTELLGPLGMGRTTARPVPPAAAGWAVHPWSDLVLAEPEHDAGAMAPAGQLWSTVGDLARWATFLDGDGVGLLEPATLAAMREPRSVAEVTSGPWTMAYGLGLQVWNQNGRRSFGHGGSMPGFLAFLEVRPGVGAAVGLANATTGLRPALGADLLDLLDRDEPRSPREWRPDAPPEGILDVLGPWYWGAAPHVVRFAGGRLVLDGLGGPARVSRFVAGADGTWTGLDGYHTGEPLRVVRGDDGTVSHLDLGSFVLTREPYAPDHVVPGGVTAEAWHVPDDRPGRRGTSEEPAEKSEDGGPEGRTTR